MKCANCGSELMPGARFCKNCGHPVAQNDDQPTVGQDTAKEAKAEPKRKVYQAVPEGSSQQRAAAEREAAAMTGTTEGTFFGPYQVKELLGRGGMANVWLAWDTKLNRDVAIKEPVFAPGLTDKVRDDMARRFIKEGQAAARLNHPNIVTIFAADEYDGRPAIIMEFVDGKTLGQMKFPLKTNEAVDILDKLLDAVEYAHSQGVVHRDIKPDNIFVDKMGQVKLADFGVAHIDGSTTTQATMAGTIIGTPSHMSPEQAKGLQVDARSDIFSVGIVAYEMLTGRNPFNFDGAEATTVIYRIVHEPVEDLNHVRGEMLPENVRYAVLRALDKDPDNRPQSAAEFKRLLHGKIPQVNIPTNAGAPSGRSGATVVVGQEPQPAYVQPGNQGYNPAYDPAYNQQVYPQQGYPPAGGYPQNGAYYGNQGGRNQGGVPRWLPFALSGLACIVALVTVIFVLNSGSPAPVAKTPPTTSSQPADSDEGKESSDEEKEDEDDSSTTVVEAPEEKTESKSEEKTEEKKPEEKSPTSTTTVEVKGQYPPSFSSASASSTLPRDQYNLDYSPSCVLDGNYQSAWNANHSSSYGVGDSITVSAGSAQHVSGVDIVNGYPMTERIYNSNPRPKVLVVELSDGYSAELSLSDLFNTRQTFDFDGEHDVTWMKFTIKSVYYPSDKNYDTCCIAEISAH